MWGKECGLRMGFQTKRPANIVIDSATYLLTISSPHINKVAMSLYDITTKFVDITDSKAFFCSSEASIVCFQTRMVQ